MRNAFGLLLVVVCCIASVDTSATASVAHQRTIPCREAIENPPFPYLGNALRRYRSRLVLGAVSVPPAYLEQTAPTGETPWTYFSKWGMVVKRGRSVTITVPWRWRQQLGIVWGNHGHGVFSSIRIAACRTVLGGGYAYAGGFYLRSPSACVPLVFGVGSRRQTVWFGVGQRCR